MSPLWFPLWVLCVFISLPAPSAYGLCSTDFLKKLTSGSVNSVFYFVGFHCGVLFPSSCPAGSQSLGFVVSDCSFEGFLPSGRSPRSRPARAAGSGARGCCWASQLERPRPFGSFLQPEDALPLLSGVYSFENILGIFLLLILILFNCGQRKHL